MDPILSGASGQQPLASSSGQTEALIDERLGKTNLSERTKHVHKVALSALAAWLENSAAETTFEKILNTPGRANADPILIECKAYLAANNQPTAARCLFAAVDAVRPDDPAWLLIDERLGALTDLTPSTKAHYQAALRALAALLENSAEETTFEKILNTLGPANVDPILKACKADLEKTSQKHAAEHLFAAVDVARPDDPVTKLINEKLRARPDLAAMTKRNYKVVFKAIAAWLENSDKDTTLETILGKPGPANDDPILIECLAHLEGTDQTTAARNLFPAVDAVRPDDPVEKLLDQKLRARSDLAAGTKRNYKVVFKAIAAWLRKSAKETTIEEILGKPGPANDNPILKECLAHLVETKQKTAIKYFSSAVNAVHRDDPAGPGIDHPSRSEAKAVFDQMIGLSETAPEDVADEDREIYERLQHLFSYIQSPNIMDPIPHPSRGEIEAVIAQMTRLSVTEPEDVAEEDRGTYERIHDLISRTM